jgi:hypothetical protein
MQRCAPTQRGFTMMHLVGHAEPTDSQVLHGAIVMAPKISPGRRRNRAGTLSAEAQLEIPSLRSYVRADRADCGVPLELASDPPVAGPRARVVSQAQEHLGSERGGGAPRLRRAMMSSPVRSYIEVGFRGRCGPASHCAPTRHRISLAVPSGSVVTRVPSQSTRGQGDGKVEDNYQDNNLLPTRYPEAATMSVANENHVTTKRGLSSVQFVA